MRLSKLLLIVFAMNMVLFASMSSKDSAYINKWLGVEANSNKAEEKKIISFIQFKDIKLENLFNYISAKYDVNIVTEEPMLRYYTTSIQLKNVSVEEIIKIVSKQHNLHYTKNNQTYYISTRRKHHSDNYNEQNFITKKVEVEYASVMDVVFFLKDVMQGTAVIRTNTTNEPYSGLFDATPKLEESSTIEENGDDGILPTIRDNKESSTTNNMQQQNNIARDGMGLSGAKDSTPNSIIYIVPFFNENMIYLISKDQNLIDKAKKYITEVDQPIKEVLIQGKIISIGLDDGFSSFFEFNRRSTALEATEPNAQSLVNVGNLQYKFLDSLTSMNIEILQSEGRAKTIASPMLLTANRNKATLQLTEEVSIIKGWTAGTVTQVEGGGAVTTPSIPEYEVETIGTTFDIIPFINENNEILLKIKINISTLKPGSQQLLVPNGTGGYDTQRLDGVGTTTIETTLVTTHGQGIVLGGLINETVSKKEDKVPILGDIPYLGFPFKSISDVTTKNETVVILTPFITNLKRPDSHTAVKNLRKSIEDDRYISDDNKTKMAPRKLIENLKDEDNDIIYKDNNNNIFTGDKGGS